MSSTGFDYLASALGLGFGLTAIVATLFLVSGFPESGAYLDILLFGVMGAIAGAVTWRISHPRRKNLFVASD